MEAIGKFDFTATEHTELSFRKGDTIKILGTKDDWYRAEKQGTLGFVPKNYITLNVPSWYQKDMSRHEAEATLMCQPVGSFIVRNSQNDEDNFSLSVRHKKDVQHFKVLRSTRGQYYLWCDKFNSLNTLVEYYTVNSISKQECLCLFTQKPSDIVPQAGPVPQARMQTQSAKNDSKRSAAPPCPAPRPKEILVPPPSSLQQVKALYTFSAEEKDELDFSEGDIIEVLERSESFWWMGRLRGRTGLFPSNYTAPL